MAKRTSGRLPARRLDNLRAALKKGMPDDGPENDTAHEIDANLTVLLRKERSRVGLSRMTPARRRYLAIAELNEGVKCDGLLVGVVCNDPEILIAALEAAGALKITALKPVLAAARKCLPPKSMMSPRAVVSRYNWYATPAAANQAARLEELEERFHEAEPRAGCVGVCLTHALRNAAEFFDTE